MHIEHSLGFVLRIVFAGRIISMAHAASLRRCAFLRNVFQWADAVIFPVPDNPTSHSEPVIACPERLSDSDAV